MTGDAALLAARAVARRFGAQTALQPVDLAVWGGDVVALVGPNGAGKSTLLAILAGALEPSSGTVLRRDGTRTGWMPQRPAHYGRLSARQNLELFARLEGDADPRSAAARLLDRFELPSDDRASSSLSVGNRQRLDLALAVLGEPNVLLLDEPTAALDPRQRRRLWQTAGAIKEQGGAVVLVTQNVEDLERVADRVAVLREGALVFDGGLDEYQGSEAADVFA